MHRYHRFLWLGLFISAGLAAPGCGSQVNVEPGGQGAGGSTSVSSAATGSTTGTGGSGASTPCGNGPGVVLAMNRLLIGDTDPNGAPNAQNGWKQYGLNLDGLISTKTSTDLCKPAAGSAPSAVYPDGNNGIDNSFGKNILPILLGLAPDVGMQVNQSILDGNFTLMLKIEGLGASPGQLHGRLQALRRRPARHAAPVRRYGHVAGGARVAPESKRYRIGEKRVPAKHHRRRCLSIRF